MKVQFNGPEAECEVFGLVFLRDEPVDVSGLSDAHKAKLAANPTFSEAKRRTRAATDEAA